MKRGLWGFLTFTCAMMALAGISAFSTDQNSTDLILGILFIPLTALCARKFFRPESRFFPERRTYIPGSPLPIVPSPGLVLAHGEICHLAERVKVGRLKTVRTGTVTSHSGGGIRVAKGFSIRSGTSVSRSILKDVLDTTPGTLYVSNRRIVAASPKYNFDKPLSALSSYTMYTDGFALQFGKETFTVLVKEPIYAMDVLLTAVSVYA